MHVDVFGQSSVHLYEVNVVDHAKSLGPTMLPLSPSEPKGGTFKATYIHVTMLLHWSVLPVTQLFCYHLH